MTKSQKLIMGKLVFLFVSDYCATFWTKKGKLLYLRGKVCMSLIRKSPIYLCSMSEIPIVLRVATCWWFEKMSQIMVFETEVTQLNKKLKPGVRFTAYGNSSGIKICLHYDWRLEFGISSIDRFELKALLKKIGSYHWDSLLGGVPNSCLKPCPS